MRFSLTPGDAPTGGVFSARGACREHSRCGLEVRRAIAPNAADAESAALVVFGTMSQRRSLALSV